jgi:hypothetical protein
VVVAVLSSDIDRGIIAILIGLLVALICGLLLMRADLIDKWIVRIQAGRRFGKQDPASMRRGLVLASGAGVVFGLLVVGLGVAAMIR